MNAQLAPSLSPSPALRLAVERRLAECVALVNARRPGFATPKLYYYTKRLAAGIATYSEHSIGLNLTLLEENPDEMLRDTIAHEVAHLTCHHLHVLGLLSRGWRGHGRHWKGVMRTYFGIEPKRTHDYDCENVGAKRQRRWLYKCPCRTHEMTTVKHNRMRKFEARGYGSRYRCARCGIPLVFQGAKP